jgi:hypothetical protein
MPFLEMLPNLVDKDAAWAMKAEDIADESDDSRSIDEDDETTETLPSSEAEPAPPPPLKTTPPVLHRDRKPSLPKQPVTVTGGGEGLDFPGRQIINNLLKVAQKLNGYESDEIAHEITRLETKMFLDRKVSIF